MAYRATPNSVTGYSPFHLLHGREVVLPSSDNLKVKISQENPDHKRRLESLKSGLKLAYQAVGKANRTSHRNNKRLYDRKAKSRYFKVGDLVYLHNPSVKKGLSKKFSKPWTGLFQATKRHSELNYVITDQNGKKQVVHINRLKKTYNADLWKPKTQNNTVKNKLKTRTECTEEKEEAELQIRSFLLTDASRVASNREHDTPPNQIQTDTSTAQLSPGSPSVDHRDPSYYPPETPKSQRELQTTRNIPPISF